MEGRGAGGGGGTSSGSLPLVVKPNFNQSSCKDKSTSTSVKVERSDNLQDEDKCSMIRTTGGGGAPSASFSAHLNRRRYSSPPGIVVKTEPVECISLPDQRIKLIREGLLRQECPDRDIKKEKNVTPKSEDILP